MKRMPTAVCLSCLTPSGADMKALADTYVACAKCGARFYDATREGDWEPCAECHGEGGREIPAQKVFMFCPSCSGNGWRFARYGPPVHVRVVAE